MGHAAVFCNERSSAFFGGGGANMTKIWDYAVAVFFQYILYKC